MDFSQNSKEDELKENFSISNSFKIKFDFEISKQNALAIFLSYGEIESFQINKSNIEISYYDFISSMKMYNEFTFNCLKLKENNIKISFHNHEDFYNKFFISIIIESSLSEKLLIYYFLLCKFILRNKIYKIYRKIINNFKIYLIFQFIDSREKEKMQFILEKLTEKNNNLNSELNIEDNQININQNILNTFSIIYIYHKSNEYNCQNILNHNNISNENKENIYSININIEKDLTQKSKENSIKNLIKKTIYPNKENIKNKFTGLKSRNTSEEERKKYQIVIEDIINEKDQRTTIMIKNIPRYISQTFLMSFLNGKYKGKFNFLYLPIDFVKKINVSYAFLNLKNSKDIIELYLDLHAKPWSFCKNKKSYISYARIQGFKSISEHFSKSNLMKYQLDNSFKPYINDD